MRVLFVAGSFPPMHCGVGDYTENLAKSLAEDHRFDVAVLTDRGAEKYVLNSSRLELLPEVDNWNMPYLWKIVSKIRRWRPDIVHVQYPTLGYGMAWGPYWLPLILAGLRQQVIQTWHEPPTQFRFLPNAITRDHLIGVEPDFLDQIRRRYRPFVARKKTYFIPVSSNIPAIALNSAEKEQVRAKYGLPNKQIVANFGFAYERKRLELIFEVCDPEKHHLLFIMDLDRRHSDYHRRILDLTEKVPWRGNVTITGFLEPNEIASLLASASIALFPFAEGVGMRNGSYLAAREQGTYCVVTSKWKTGMDYPSNTLFVAPDDLDGMRDAMAVGAPVSDIYSHGHEHRPLTWRDIASQHARLYLEVGECGN